MGATRRRVTLEFKTEAAHRVIDTGRTIWDTGAAGCHVPPLVAGSARVGFCLGFFAFAGRRPGCYIPMPRCGGTGVGWIVGGGA